MTHTLVHSTKDYFWLDTQHYYKKQRWNGLGFWR